MRVSQMILAATLALALPEQSLSQEISDDRIKALVAETLRENPELVLEALQALEVRQAEMQAAAAMAVVTEERGLLERDPNAPILGNPDGDVTIVEFFDYNCPYCKRAMPEVNALMAEDTNVRLVLREWPILSEGSAFAARAALASRQQGKYAEMHDALMMMHGHAFQVVSTGGARFAGAVRDTVHVPPMGMVTVAVDAGEAARWMLHCHHMPHLSTGMMTEFAVTA